MLLPVLDVLDLVWNGICSFCTLWAGLCQDPTGVRVTGVSSTLSSERGPAPVGPARLSLSCCFVQEHSQQGSVGICTLSDGKAPLELQS